MEPLELSQAYRDLTPPPLPFRVLNTKDKKITPFQVKDIRTNTLVVYSLEGVHQEMADRVAGENTRGGPSEGDQSSAELTRLKADVGSLAEQISRLTLLVGELTRKEEEPSDARGSDAGRSDPRESAAAASAEVQEGASQTGSAQDDTYLRERFGASGPEGRHSGEARGYVPQEVRVAASHNPGGLSSSIGGGAAAGFAGGIGIPVGSAGYQSVRYSSPPFEGKAKIFISWLQDFCLVANGANLLDHLRRGQWRSP